MMGDSEMRAGFRLVITVIETAKNDSPLSRRESAGVFMLYLASNITKSANDYGSCRIGSMIFNTARAEPLKYLVAVQRIAASHYSIPLAV